MRRLIAVVSLLLGLIATAPAYADVSISIHAGQTTLMAGESTSISGRVPGAEPGSVVKLQHKFDGAWTTVKSKVIRSTRTYRFSVSPLEGYQYYRVAKPRQLGQPSAVSSTLKLTVRWSPTLTASAEYLADPDTQAQTIRITGKVTEGPSSPEVALERRDADGWTTLETRTVTPDADFTFERTAATGPRYRLRLLPTALTTQQVSPTFVHTMAPYHLAMNSSLKIHDLGPSSGAAALFDLRADAGDYVTLVASSYGVQFVGTVTAPSGEQVATLSRHPDDLARFTAPESGTYTIEISQMESSAYEFTLIASTPKVVTTSIDAPRITVSSDLQGQPVDVRFDTAGTHLFTSANWTTTGDTVSVLDPGGTPVQPWIPGVLRYRDPIYRAAGGTYTLRLEPDYLINDVWVNPLSVTTVTGTVNGAVTEAVVDVPQRVVLVEFDRPAEHVTVGYDETQLSNVGVFDATTGEPAPDGPGTSVVAVSAYDDRTMTVPIELTTPYHIDTTIDGPATAVDLTPTYQREIALHFTASAGQAVASRVVSDDFWVVESLTGPDGSPVTNLLGVGGLWVIPSDGDYTVTMMAHGSEAGSTWEGIWRGSVAIESADTVTIPGDGTPTTVTIDEPGEAILATVPMAAGTKVDATLDEVSASLGDTWFAELYTPDHSYWYNSWRIPGTLPPFIVQEPGDIVAVIGAQQTGSLRLTFAPRP